MATLESGAAWWGAVADGEQEASSWRADVRVQAGCSEGAGSGWQCGQCVDYGRSAVHSKAAGSAAAGGGTVALDMGERVGSKAGASWQRVVGRVEGLYELGLGMASWQVHPRTPGRQVVTRWWILG